MDKPRGYLSLKRRPGQYITVSANGKPAISIFISKIEDSSWDAWNHSGSRDKMDVKKFLDRLIVRIGIKAPGYEISRSVEEPTICAGLLVQNPKGRS